MQRLRGAAYGLLSAALFGASAPFAKLLLDRTSPLMLSALLYLGAGAALTMHRVASQAGASRDHPSEARIRGADYAMLAAVAIVGGVAGPVLMLTGLARVSALSGALALNLEGPFTILIAVAVFGEHLGIREAGAAAIIMIGAVMLGLEGGHLGGSIAGIGAIAAACCAWGLDNNLSQRLSLRDPIALAQVKTLVAGSLTMLLAIAWGARLPAGAIVAAALALGAISYGASLVFDILALRDLGAAREAAYFATAPFIGAIVAIPLFRAFPSMIKLGASMLMATGVVLLLRERHTHIHTHEAMEHDHQHVHDEHHQHPHDGPISEPHSHTHRHDELTHAHSHASDLHHRHRHA